MRSVNKVILIGNLTRDPEMRQTPNGQNVTTFGIATNREWTTSDKEKKSSAEFHECVAWANLAEICQKYIQKGHLVYVEGYLKTRSWDSPEGIKKFKTEIVVHDMIRLEKRPKSAQDEEYVPETTALAAESTAESTSESSSEPEVESDPDVAEESSEKTGSENIVDKDLGL